MHTSYILGSKCRKGLSNWAAVVLLQGYEYPIIILQEGTCKSTGGGWKEAHVGD